MSVPQVLCRPIGAESQYRGVMYDLPARSLALQNAQPVKHLPTQQTTRPISLLLEHMAPGQKAPALISLPMAPHETISSVKMRVRTSSQFTSDHVLVLGDRQLLDHETVGQLAQAARRSGSSAGYLHILVRLKDVESVELRSSLQRSIDWQASKGLRVSKPLPGDQAFTMRRSTSALTNLLQHDGVDRAFNGSLARPDQLRPLSRTSSVPGDGIVHLIIQKPYKLGWRHQPGADQVELSISADTTAGAVAAELEKLDHLPAGNHRLSFNGHVLASHQSLASYGIGSNAVLELAPLDTGIYGVPGTRTACQASNISRRPFSCNSTEKGSPPLSSPEHALFQGWQAAQAGLASGLVPQLTASSSGGTYFCRGADGSVVAVLKPADEEPYGANNPRMHLGCSPDGHGLRKGIRPGEGAIREVAAFLLDHKGFAGVPPTALVTCKASQISTQPSHLHALPPLAPNPKPKLSAARLASSDAALSTALSRQLSITPMPSAKQHAAATSQQAAAAAAQYGEKLSSLQMFVIADTDCEECGPSSFSAHEVHKIAQLDMRLANADRNASNILARRGGPGGWTLIPIDHGYCLPSSFQDISFEWMNWPQARVPFSQETRDYIAALDCQADLALLAAHGLHLRSECQRVARATTAVLQLGAARNMTPFTIASVMCREALTKSPLEKLHMRAMQLSRGQALLSLASDAAALESAAEHERVYFHHLQDLIEQYLDEIILDDGRFL